MIAERLADRVSMLLSSLNWTATPENGNYTIVSGKENALEQTHLFKQKE